MSNGSGQQAAGYSGKPVAVKLGVTDRSRMLLLDAPAAFALRAPPEAEILRRDTAPSYDLALAFCLERAEVEARFIELPARIITAGALWIAWPKKASKVTTELDENVVRAIGLAAGLVDVKVIAIDETWSGLKFVRRVRDR